MFLSNKVTFWNRCQFINEKHCYALSIFLQINKMELQNSISKKSPLEKSITRNVVIAFWMDSNISSLYDILVVNLLKQHPKNAVFKMINPSDFILMHAFLDLTFYCRKRWHVCHTHSETWQLEISSLIHFARIRLNGHSIRQSKRFHQTPPLQVWYLRNFSVRHCCLLRV